MLKVFVGAAYVPSVIRHANKVFDCHNQEIKTIMLNKELWEAVNKSIGPEPEDNRFDGASFFEVFIFEICSNWQLEKKYRARLEEVLKTSNSPYDDRTLLFIAREMKKRFRSGSVHFYTWNILSMLRLAKKKSDSDSQKDSAEYQYHQFPTSNIVATAIFVLGGIPLAYAKIANHDIASWLIFSGSSTSLVGLGVLLNKYLRLRVLFPVLLLIAVFLLWFTIILQRTG
jgi:hypothetical protein